MKMAENGGRSWRRITRRLFYSSSSISSSFGKFSLAKVFLGFLRIKFGINLFDSFV